MVVVLGERDFHPLNYTYQKYLNVQNKIILLLGIYPKETIKTAWNNSTAMIFRPVLTIKKLKSIRNHLNDGKFI